MKEVTMTIEGGRGSVPEALKHGWEFLETGTA